MKESTTKKELIQKVLDLNYENNIGHISSSLSQVEYLYYLIKNIRYLDYDWIAGKQFGNTAYYAVYKQLGMEDLIPNKIEPLFYNHVNKEFRFVEETLGNALGVSIGLALTQTKPIWINVSDSIFQMGQTLETLRLIKQQNLNLLVTVDLNYCTRTKNDLGIDIEKLINSFDLKYITLDSDQLQTNEKYISEYLHSTGPRFILFKTKKGDGIKKVEENPIDYHYKLLSENEYSEFTKELR